MADDSPTPPAEQGNDGTASGGPLSGTRLWVAIGVLIAFAIFVAFMIGQVDTGSEVEWTRLAWLFASVEAIAFGAAGALFGSTIQRQRAEKAEEVAAKNAGDAANGQALAATLKADEPAEKRGEFRAVGGESTPEAASVAARHAELARRLFPD